ncbi:MAG: hypothetical protein R2941_19920 [Desulfobacterales bacterium]
MTYPGSPGLFSPIPDFPVPNWKLRSVCIYTVFIKKQNAICIDSGLLVSGIKIAFQKYVRIANTDIKKIKIVYIDSKTSSPLRQVIFWKICKYTDPALLFQKNGTSSHTNSPLKSYFAEGNADSPLILCGAVRFLRPLCPLCVLCG